MITEKELKKLLHYNPVTGIFTWIKSIGCVRAGDVAGSLHDKGYIRIGINNKDYKAHRLAWLYMTGSLPEKQIDHKDHIRYNNKWDNLRKATNQENQENRVISRNNTSEITGVFWMKKTNRWRAQIKGSANRVMLGDYKGKFEAACARKSAENKYGYHENHGVKI